MVLGFIEKPGASLNELAQSFLALGIDARINGFSVVFLRAIFAQALNLFKNKCPLPLPVLPRFGAINIVDSSTKTLSDQMAEEYPGGEASRQP